jgi:hypothetical protein
MKSLAFCIKQNLRNFEMKLAKNFLGARFYNVHAYPLLLNHASHHITIKAVTNKGGPLKG